MARRVSAGLLLYRRGPVGVEVLLAHPGGPYFLARDIGAWTIPKGEIEDGEEPYAVARREFHEEVGHEAPDAAPIDLGEIRQKGGKLVRAWAVEGDLDPATAVSNTFPLEFPRGSGRYLETPEVDRVEWFPVDEARRRIKETQIPLIDRLLDALKA